MNKTELVAAVAQKAELSKKDAEKAVAAVTAAITDALCAGDKVQLVGFGTFEVRNREARTGKNPRTAKLFKSLHQRFLHSRQVRLLRTL